MSGFKTDAKMRWFEWRERNERYMNKMKARFEKTAEAEATHPAEMRAGRTVQPRSVRTGKPGYQTGRSPLSLSLSSLLSVRTRSASLSRVSPNLPSSPLCAAPSLTPPPSSPSLLHSALQHCGESLELASL